MIFALTHGAGSDCNSALLLQVEAGLTKAGHRAFRYNLTGQVQRPEANREVIRRKLAELRAEFPGERLIAGGHSYGGRQTTMVAAESPELLDGLLLLSYPLHPPRKPEELRTAHFPDIRTPALFIHGTRDQFGLPEAMERAISLIPAPARLVLIDRAGHGLINAALAREFFA